MPDSLWKWMNTPTLWIMRQEFQSNNNMEEYCLALALGLFVAVSRKKPSSERFPYGFWSLSGFGNGVFPLYVRPYFHELPNYVTVRQS
jgi:hypothetical protein